MSFTCPRCKRTLSAADAGGLPAFCMYCGQKLRHDPGADDGEMLTTSHVPFSANPDEDDSY